MVLKITVNMIRKSVIRTNNVMEINVKYKNTHLIDVNIF